MLQVLEKLFFVAMLLVTCLFGAAMLRPIWNGVMPDLFGLKRLTPKQAFLLMGVSLAFVIAAFMTVWLMRIIFRVPMQ